MEKLMSGTILGSARITADKIDLVEPIDYIDGAAIARGRVNLIYADGSTGKSTSIRTTCVSAASTGLWNFIGKRQHKEPLRVVALFGEESESDILNGIKTAKHEEMFKKAVAAETLLFVALQDYQQRIGKVDDIWDEKGNLTPNFGFPLFQEIESYNPDVVIVDTLTSVSSGGLEDATESKKVVQFLNSFASKTNAAVIATGHILRKSGNSAVTEKSTYEELSDMNRGSGQLKNVTRNIINIFKAPKNMFPDFRPRDEHDEMLVAVSKSNLQGYGLPRQQVYPLHRDSRQFTITALSPSGEFLFKKEERGDEKELEELQILLQDVVEAGSRLNFPFAANPRNAKSIQKLASGSLADTLGKYKVSNIDKALAILERQNFIVQCTFSKLGGSSVYDVPHGKYANETTYEKETGEKVPFVKGAGPSAAELEYEIRRIKKGLPECGDEEEDKAEKPSGLVLKDVNTPF